MNISHIPRGPGEKRDLVDRRVPRHLVRVRTDEPGTRAGERRKLRDERGREQVDVGGHAVVQQIPDHLDVVPARRVEVRQDRVEVVNARRRLDAMPADGVADRRDADVGEPGIVLVDEAIVLRSSCLKLLTEARRPNQKTAPASGQEDALFAELSGVRPMSDRRPSSCLH